MISISGIKYQKELESLPYLNKKEAGILIGKKGKNLDKKIDQLMGKGYLSVLKKGLYTTSSFYEKTEKSLYCEYIANILRSPSYISLEYVLSKEGLIPEGVYIITSITIKSTRSFTNFMGTFSYTNLKKSLFLGYKEKIWADTTIYLASRAKALFDYLYLKKLININQEILSDLRLNWNQFTKTDLVEFKDYVDLSKSKKMLTILEIIKKIYVS